MTRSERFKRLACTDHLRGDLRRSSVRATFFTGMAGIADLLLRIGSTAVLARFLLPEHFGVVMMVTAVTAIADQLRDLGLSTATVQKKEITHEEISNLFWVNVGAGLVITAVICAVSPLLSMYYRDPRLTTITCLLATNFFFGGLMVQHQALLARRLQLGTSALVRLLSSLVSTAVAILLAWKGAGYWALVWREVIRSVLLALGMWLCFPWIPGLPSRKTDIRGLLRFGVHLSAANIFCSITAGIDRFLIGRVWGAAAVGIYRQAYQLIVVPTDQLLSPVYQVTQPGLSLLQSDPEKYRRFYRKALTAVCLVTMPGSLFVAVYAREVVMVLLGSKWVDCIPLFAILSLGAFIRQAVGSAAWVLITCGRSRTYLYLTVFQNVLIIPFMLAGVRWGAIGVAIADTVAAYVLMFPRLYYCLRDSHVSLRYFLGSIARPALVSIAMALALLAFRWAVPIDNVVLSLVAGSLAGLAVFGLAWLTLPGGRTELAVYLSDVRALWQRKTAPVQPAESVAG